MNPKAFGAKGGVIMLLPEQNPGGFVLFFCFCVCVCVGAVQYLGGTDVNPNLKIPVVPVERSRLWLHNVATRIIGAPPPPDQRCWLE